MKKYLIHLTIFLFTITLFAQEELNIKFYFDDGKTRQYSVEDIKNISFLILSENSLMRIYFEDSLLSQLSLFRIDSINFEKNLSDTILLKIFDNGNSTQFILSDIDSINFYNFPLPYIVNINPISATAGDEITILGLNFGDSSDSNVVSFSGVVVTEIIEWSENKIILRLPTEAFSGKVFIKVNGFRSNEVDFVVLPNIKSIEPLSANTGDTISINGSGFGTEQDSNFVSIGDIIMLDVISWSNNKIEVKIPESINSYIVFVNVGSNKSNEFDISVNTFISEIVPNTGLIGDEITINGSGFGSTRGSSFVSFLGANVIDYKNWSANSIVVKVPLGAETGKVSVTINSQKSNEMEFSIIPFITGIVPSYPMIGNEITIYGNGFGKIRNSGFVSFEGITASEYVRWSDTVIIVKVPQKAERGKLFVTASGYKSNGIDFTVLPAIKNINPSSAKINNSITISGSGFGNERDTSIVSFNGIEATEYLNWATTTIVVKVPNSAESGKLSVTVDGLKSNEVDFHVLPEIASIEPISAKIFDNITIAGNGFGNSKGIGYVSFKGANATEYLSWSTSSIVVKVPSGAETGKLSVTQSGMKSNEVDFSVIPYITSVVPTSGKVDDDITITGTGFGTTQGSSFVSFIGSNVSEYLSWSSTSIKVKVPAGAETGKLSVTVNSEKSNEIDFNIIPVITGINPTSGKVGDEITISGTKFGSSRGSSIVSFTGANVNEYISWSDNSIVVKIPTGAETGKISVTVSGEKSNEIDFTIMPEYESVTIGTQVWMLKNLDVTYYRNGDPIPQVSSPTDWSNLTSGAWCYYNNESSKGDVYGKLYNWHAVNDSRGLAPEGWHISTDAEWVTLKSFLGGPDVAGGKLKEAGTSHWQSPNTGATNSSGFTALPGGHRSHTGTYFDIGIHGGWWTTTDIDATSAWYCIIYNTSADWAMSNFNKKAGFSVRCVKD